ncbi:MAG: hypothetical protein OXT67_06100 [Zetaproteobacteria bacterium]|nr:hypothetical protein [Zetaproteobacteria bacterium]
MFTVTFFHRNAGSSIIAPQAIKLMLGDQAQVFCFDCRKLFTQHLEAHQIDIAVFEDPVEELFEQVRSKYPESRIILISDQPFLELNSQLNHPISHSVDHIIGHIGNQEYVSVILRVTLLRMLTGKIFENKDFWRNEPRTARKSISDSDLKHEMCAYIENFFSKLKLSTPTIRSLRSVGEELVMNAIYDAPLSIAKKGRDYQLTERTNRMLLDKKDAAKVICCFDGRFAAICVEDPFGGLTRENFFKYVHKITRKDEGNAIIDQKTVGAGLGIYKILHLSHSLICSVHPGKKTQSLALIDTSTPVRDVSKLPRTIQFYLSAP